MFNIENYPYDEKHNCHVVAGEAMIFHCHHYLNYLQRSILDADYIESRPFLIGSAADAVFYQLKNLCQGLSVEESKTMAADVYKTFGYGLIDLSDMNENGVTVRTFKSYHSKTWLMKFGRSNKPVDYYTSGFIAAAFAVIYQRPLSEIQVEQTTCIACGAEFNTHIVQTGRGNFSIYPTKDATSYNTTPKLAIDWEHEETVTNAFLSAHTQLVGNEEGYIAAFGVYLVRNQSDYVNRLQFEFARALRNVAGDYGEQLGSELLLESGQACGFFTYGGVMTSDEWNAVVKPLLQTREDWIKGLASLINAMGWGYHTAVEISQKRTIFRNYNDFEDLSYMRLYGKTDHPVPWATSGGYVGLMHLVYNTDLVEGSITNTEEGFRQLRRSKANYKAQMTRSIASGDDFLEVVVEQTTV
jgi:hypothetical protein